MAGGLGTRLQGTVPELPKSMAPVAGQPFLTYIIRHLLSQGIEKMIFALGHKHEVIETFLSDTFYYLNYTCVVEDTPLGTGGAISLALEETSGRDVIIVNGDTLYKIDIDDLSDRHVETQADCTIALKPMQQFDRYGSVIIDEDGNVLRFNEKKFEAKGNINGGIYVLNRISFLQNEFPRIFSFEKEYLEALVDAFSFQGVIQDKYFIDIGVPEDYRRAQDELKYPVPDVSKVDVAWTLFLDRDGVINFNKDESYVFNTGEFKFIPGAVEAIRMLSAKFGKIIVITNQRGIGKGLMDEKALAEIHQYMIEEIVKGGGRIDAIYYCAFADDKHHDRKPNPGMLLEAKHMYPEINFSTSFMIGDKMSDMQLGRNAGTFTVLVNSSQSSDPDVDISCRSLKEFAEIVAG